MLEITSKTRTLGGRTVELIKQEYFRNSHQLSRIQSPLAASEANDCMVRGVMFGLDCSYEQAHQLVKTKLNRPDRKGTPMELLPKIFNITLNKKTIKYLGAHPAYLERKWWVDAAGYKTLLNPAYKKPTGYTLKSFMESHPKGRYILLVQGHCVAIVDGVLYGNKEEQYVGIYRSVWVAMECK